VIILWGIRYLYSKGEYCMDIIGKILTFLMNTFSNFAGSDSLIKDIKKGFKENSKKEN
jgi:hypothetical protein